MTATRALASRYRGSVSHCVSLLGVGSLVSFSACEETDVSRGWGGVNFNQEMLLLAMSLSLSVVAQKKVAMSQLLIRITL